MKKLAFALAASVVLSSCGLSLQSLPKIGGISGPTYKITAAFSNVVNLPANAQVRIGSFVVGQVTSIGLKDFTAEVTMKIKDSTKLPVGTSATVAFDTPLGEDYIILQPPLLTTSNPGQGFLANGDSIPEADTQNAPSVEDTFGALGALLNGGGINQLQTIITQTNLAFDGNQQQIRDLITNLDTTVTTLANDTPAIDNALQAIAALSATLENGQQTIQTGLETIGPLASVLQSETQNLTGLFNNLNALSTSANAVLDASVTGTVQTFQQLQPLLFQLTAVQAQLEPALSAIQSLETFTPRAVPGHYLQLSINATVGIPPVPAGAGTLQRVTVDPPDPLQAYNLDPTEASIAMVIEGGLP